MGTKPTTMGRYRAIMTDTDREHIRGEGDPSSRQVDQSVYRVRLRITEELAEDIEVLREERPDLLEELREVVCDPDADTDAGQGDYDRTNNGGR